MYRYRVIRRENRYYLARVDSRTGKLVEDEPVQVEADSLDGLRALAEHILVETKLRDPLNYEDAIPVAWRLG